jgi:predicted Zn-dependent protease
MKKKMKKVITVLTLVFILFMSCSKDDAATNEFDDNGNPVSNNRKPTGSSSNDLLSDKTFTSMVVEVVYVKNYEPTTTAINNFVSFLNERTFKPDGITVVKREIASPGKARYKIQDINSIEEANRTKYNSSNQIAVWTFFADGESDQNTDKGVVLGTAYRNTSFVIYEKTIQSLSGSPFQPSKSLLETTVINHEFGHILGLTNLGATPQSNHEDAEHAKHCVVKSCLMYWESETGSGISNMISGGSAPKLDAQCIADLRANGGK